MVAIIGRPNAGKSALFNRLTHRRQSLVDSTPGLTRDRLYGDVTWSGVPFRLVDTGGLQFSRREKMQEAISSQVAQAMEESALALLVCDSRDGIVALDREVASWVRRWGKPVLVVANKVDTAKDSLDTPEFSALGLGIPYPVSSLHGLGIGELLDEIVRQLGPGARAAADDSAAGEQAGGVPNPLALAIIGRPNVGKSSLINRILNEERVLVDSEPGTTRDPVETPFSYQGQVFKLIDTAGVRSQKTLKTRVDWLSRMKALEVMARAHVCVALLDASVGLIGDDLKLLDQAVSAGRPLVLAVNKWDLMPRTMDFKKVAQDIAARAPFLRFAPVICLSAKTGFHVLPLLDKIREVAAQAFKQLTPQECKGLLRLVQEHPSSPAGLRNAQWYRVTQVSVGPPVFHLTGRFGQPPRPSDIAFLDRIFRRKAGFEGTPIHIRVLDKRRS